MIETLDEASALSLTCLQEHVEPASGEPVAVTAVRPFPTCWLVGYNTSAYIEPGSISHALAGGPLIINRLNGAVRLGRSDLSAEQQLDPR